MEYRSLRRLLINPTSRGPRAKTTAGPRRAPSSLKGRRCQQASGPAWSRHLDPPDNPGCGAAIALTASSSPAAIASPATTCHSQAQVTSDRSSGAPAGQKGARHPRASELLDRVVVRTDRSARPRSNRLRAWLSQQAKDRGRARDVLVSLLRRAEGITPTGGGGGAETPWGTGEGISREVAPGDLESAATSASRLDGEAPASVSQPREGLALQFPIVVPGPWGNKSRPCGRRHRVPVAGCSKTGLSPKRRHGRRGRKTNEPARDTTCSLLLAGREPHRTSRPASGLQGGLATLV